VVLLDPDGFWANLNSFLDEVSEAGFIRPSNRRVIARATSPEEALEMLRVDVDAGGSPFPVAPEDSV
jgi:predicted Rossmann-fold nucleotide-binding protein